LPAGKKEAPQIFNLFVINPVRSIHKTAERLAQNFALKEKRKRRKFLERDFISLLYVFSKTAEF